MIYKNRVYLFKSIKQYLYTTAITNFSYFSLTAKKSKPKRLSNGFKADSYRFLNKIELLPKNQKLISFKQFDFLNDKSSLLFSFCRCLKKEQGIAFVNSVNRVSEIREVTCR